MKTALFALATAALFVPVVSAARHNDVDLPYLSCAATYPVVSLGNAGRFEAISNAPGPFMWVTGEWGFPDAGRTFVAPMTEPGWQEVAVVWGSRRAICEVQVVAEPGYGEPYHGGVYLPYDQGPNVTLTFVKLSAVPYTGVDIPFVALVFSLVLLVGAGVAVYPHAKRAFTIALR